MIIALSILTGLLGAWICYRVLFYDSNDFRDGLDRLGKEEDQWIWRRNRTQQRSEDFEDESWSSGIRAFVFLAVSIGCGMLTYYGLHSFFR
jgi:hypothetical protein